MTVLTPVSKCVPLCGLLCLAGWLSPVAGQQAERPATRLDEPLQPLVEDRTGTARQARLDAGAHFAVAHLMRERQQWARALQHFQRAWRRDPQAAALREIVPLASHLKRPAVAARYAVLAAEHEPRDPQLVVRLAVLLVRQGDVPRGLRLFEAAVALEPDAAVDPLRLGVRLEMGRLYLATGQIPAAVQNLAIVRDVLMQPDRFGIEPDELQQAFGPLEQVGMLIAEAFVRAGRYDEALAMFEEAHAIQPDAPLWAFHQARVAAAQKQWDEVETHLDRALEARVRGAGARPYELLAAMIEARAPDAAAADEQLLAELDARHRRQPDHPPLVLFYANRLREAKRYAAAEGLYQSLMKDHASPQARRGLVAVYHARKQPGPLLELLAETLTQTGSTDSIRRAVAQVAEDRPFVDGVLDHLESAGAGESPESQAAYVMGALLAIASDQFDRGDALYRQALEANGALKRDEIMERIGLALFFQEQLERAIGVYETAVREDVPAARLASLGFTLAGMLTADQQIDRALEVARGAAQRNDAPRYHSRVAWVLYHGGRYEEARRHYKEVVERYDALHHSDAMREVVKEARLTLSNLAVLQERFEESEEWLEQVLDEFPEDIGALNDLGYLWADQGKYLDRALAMVRQAVAGDPDNVAYRDSLGWAYYRLGRYRDAVQELEKATAGELSDGVILDHLGDAYWKVDRKQEARSAWRRALEAFSADADQKARQATARKLAEHEKP